MNWSMIDLRAVHEVAELRLPEHERLGRGRPSSRTRSRARRTPTAASCAPRTTPSPRRVAGSASYVSPVSASWRTRWRCEKVPRSVSWPVSRIGIPSTSRLANASASAWPQSMPPSSIVAAAALELLRQLRVDGEARRARAAAASFSARRRSAGTLVGDVDLRAVAECARRATSPGSLAEARLQALVRRAQPTCTSSASVVRLLLRHDARPRRAAAANCSRTVGCALDPLGHQRLRVARPRPARCGRSGGSRRGR